MSPLLGGAIGMASEATGRAAATPVRETDLAPALAVGVGVLCESRFDVGLGVGVATGVGRGVTGGLEVGEGVGEGEGVETSGACVGVAEGVGLGAGEATAAIAAGVAVGAGVGVAGSTPPPWARGSARRTLPSRTAAIPAVAAVGSAVAVG